MTNNLYDYLPCKINNTLPYCSNPTCSPLFLLYLFMFFLQIHTFSLQLHHLIWLTNFCCQSVAPPLTHYLFSCIIFFSNCTYFLSLRVLHPSLFLIVPGSSPCFSLKVPTVQSLRVFLINLTLSHFKIHVLLKLSLCFKLQFQLHRFSHCFLKQFVKLFPCI